MGWFRQIMEAPERVAGLNWRNLNLVYRYNDRKDFALANDKVQAKSFMHELAIPTPKTFHIYDGLYGLDNLSEELALYKEFVVKPALGSRGNGIRLVRQTEQGVYRSGRKSMDARQLSQFIASIIFGKYSMGQHDQAIIEELIHPHPLLKDLSGPGLPDIRILLAEERPLAGMLRLTTEDSGGKANLHQGGIGVGLDLVTGETTGAIFEGKPVTEHPETGVELIGRRLPHWDQVMDISLKIARNCPLKYLGIDLTLGRDQGPLVIEFNARPGLEIQNVTGVGLREVL